MRVPRFVLAGVMMSAGAAPALAQCYRVGPGGTHATLQPAVDAALAPGGLDCIRVAAGHRLERVRLPDSLRGRSLAISGGWTDAFLRQTGITTLDGGGSAPVVAVLARSGRLSFARFRIVRGNRPTLGTPTGGGLRLSLHGSASFLLEDCEVQDNRLSSAAGSEGGGLWADLGGSANLRIVRTTFAGNAALASAGQAFGGGASISGGEAARVDVLSSHFVGNEVSGPEFTEAAALDLFIAGTGSAEVSDNTFRGNRALSAVADAWSVVKLAAGRVAGPDSATLVARRNQVQGNLVQHPIGHQLELRATEGTTLALTDTLVSDSAGTGILAWPTGTGTMHLTNLTVTRQAVNGMRVIGGAETVFLSNSILYGNGTDLNGAARLRSNRIGLDPSFLDPAGADYHLAPGSPAIDAGSNRVPGGLGPLDLDRQPRVQGWQVDQGAYETAAGADEGPGCHIRALGIPAPRYTGACRCLSDDSLREFHCGFFLPELFLDVRFPFASQPGQPLPVEWTIHPWTSMGNGPYGLRSEALIGGQWVPQTWLGPSAPALKRGQPVVEPFLVSVPPGGPTPLRATLTYPRSGGQGRARISVEVFLPDTAPKPDPQEPREP